MLILGVKLHRHCSHVNALKHNVPLNDWLFKNAVPASKKTQRFTITKINWLTLCKEIIAVYSENYTKYINTLCWQNANFLNVIAGGTYSYHKP
jgi:hypothetical protein